MSTQTSTYLVLSILYNIVTISWGQFGGPKICPRSELENMPYFENCGCIGSYEMQEPWSCGGICEDTDTNTNPTTGLFKCSSSQKWPWIRCAPGYSETAQLNVCTPCPAGTKKPFWDENEFTYPGFSEGQCSTCPVNHYSSSASSSCLGCPVNTVAPPGSERCSCNSGYGYFPRTVYPNYPN